MTYDDLADAQRRSALTLAKLDLAAHARAICSRTYYATYALLSAEAPSTLRPKNGAWTNLDHTQIPGVVDHISGLSATEKREIKAALTRLKDSRTASDYHPHVPVGHEEARERLRDCIAIVVRLRHG